MIASSASLTVSNTETINKGSTVLFCRTFFVFHSNLGTTNNHRIGLSNISYQCFFNRNLNSMKKFSKSCFNAEENFFSSFFKGHLMFKVKYSQLCLFR